MAKEIKFNIKPGACGKEQLATAALLSTAKIVSKPRSYPYVLPIPPSPNDCAGNYQEEEHESYLYEIVVSTKEEAAHGNPKHPCPNLGKQIIALFCGLTNFKRYLHVNAWLAAVAICSCLFHAFGFYFCQSYIYSFN